MTSLIVGLAVAGCSATSNPTGAAQHHDTTMSAADRFARLSPEWRRATIVRAITDNGQQCDRVLGAAYQQDVRGMAMWTAQCHDGGQWAIYIGQQGYAQVGRCADLSVSDLPPCEVASAKRRDGRDSELSEHRLYGDRGPSA